MKAKVYSLESGDMLGNEVELDDNVFNIAYDNTFISMYFARMKKAGYTPTNTTKNISEISGTTRKPYKQKHTGNARQGSTRSAQMRGGAIAFGPRAMDRKIKIPKGEASLAKAMLLSKIATMQKLFVIQKAQFNSLKTSNAKKVLAKFSVGKVVIVNDGNVDANSLLAVKNLQNAKFVSNDMLTARDLFYADAVLIDVNSVNNFAKVLSVESNEN